VKALLVTVFLIGLACASANAAESTLSHGRFEAIRLRAPARTPEQFVMLLAGAADSNVDRMAKQLSESGALVATIDTASLFANLERDGAECVSPDGDLENLSHYIQALQRLPAYHTPILVGDGIGAPFVYAMLAQAPKETFAGGISLHFCPELELRKPLCKDHRLSYTMRKSGGATLLPAQLDRSWSAINPTVNPAINEQCAVAARSFVQRVTGVVPTQLDVRAGDAQLVRTYSKLASTVEPTSGAPPEQLADLPLIEVPASTSASLSTSLTGDTFAILFSGDGGWAGLDKDVAGAIAAEGISVVGVDSLRYFWSERTPDSLARDIERIVRTYAQRWGRARTVLIGYSQGADVLPFAINRIDAATHARLSGAVLIGLAERAQFEFHVGNWIGLDDEEGLPTEPEVKRVRAPRLICIYGEDDEESTCDAYSGSRVHVIKLPGGHHFDGDYKGLARVIVRETK
jgi:type IV secretory pathway VirJ component